MQIKTMKTRCRLLMQLMMKVNLAHKTYWVFVIGLLTETTLLRLNGIA